MKELLWFVLVVVYREHASNYKTCRAAIVKSGVRKETQNQANGNMCIQTLRKSTQRWHGNVFVNQIIDRVASNLLRFENPTRRIPRYASLRQNKVILYSSLWLQWHLFLSTTMLYKSHLDSIKLYKYPHFMSYPNPPNISPYLAPATSPNNAHIWMLALILVNFQQFHYNDGFLWVWVAKHTHTSTKQRKPTNLQN